MTVSARDRILQTAGDLFFQYGYRAIGIDLIIAQSGVAKATLYRYFPAKDDLIAAYLEETNQRFWNWFDAAAAHGETPRDQLERVFEALQKLVTTPTCHGCPFLMAATEFPDRDHPGHQVAVRHKDAVRARFQALCESASLRNASVLADHLLLLLDGAFMAVRLYGIDNPAREVAASAKRLIACASG